MLNQPNEAPSPFLPGTKIQYAWDSTSIGAIKLCPRYYYYTIICGYVPKDEPVHLRFGIEYHEALQNYEIFRAEGLDFNDAVRETMGKLLVSSHDFDPDPTTKAGNYKNPETLRQLVVDYLDEFRNDPCKTLILANGKPAVELSFRWELDWGPLDQQGAEAEKVVQPYVLCGHLDRVVTYNDDLFVLDHKTTQSAPTDYYFAGFSPNNQVTLYSLAGQIVLDSPMRGVIIEAAQILLETPNRFARRPIYTSDQLIHEWLGDLEPVLQMAEDYARAEYWPMNDTACGMYGGCKFRGVCSKNPEVRKHYLNADFTQLEEDMRWNPLKSR
jgi:hypothetical protein